MSEQLEGYEVIYSKALQKFGVDSQLDKLVEEMAELIVAIQHYKSGRVNNVAEEIADVDIVLNQIKIVFSEGDNNYNVWTNFKMNKLKLMVI